MTTTILPVKANVKTFPTFLLAALCTALLFGYIDEGYYDFRWMNNIGNWIVLGIYALMMLIGQLVFFHIILSRYSGKGRLAMSVIFGCVLGAGALIMFVFNT